MGFEYTKKAKDTMYAGCLFRSRLEATWAAFFDICGIKWVYEPFDLPGWSPDFLLADCFIVEVKPFRECDSTLSQKMLKATEGTQWSPLFLGPDPYSDYEIGTHIAPMLQHSIGSDGFTYTKTIPSESHVFICNEGSAFCKWLYEENADAEMSLDVSPFCKSGIEGMLKVCFNQAKNKVRFTVR